ncbi:MAG: DUF58 domain-containing protein [Planctomycetota bacterium]|nr:MAG: DUF58 domain-containing protein [Planctomycetota bacterium]
MGGRGRGGEQRRPRWPDPRPRSGALIQEASDRADLQDLLREVRRAEILGRRLAADLLSGAWASIFRGAGVEFHEVREWVEGDDPRAVDAVLSARAGRPLVKQFVDERRRTLLFLLDLAPSLDAGLGAWTPRQAAARIGAAVGEAAVAHGDRVGLVAFDSRIRLVVPPGHGRGALLRILRGMLALPAAGGAGGAAEALRFATRSIRRHAIILLFSDLLRPDWRQTVYACALRHDLIAAHLLAPELVELPEAVVRLRDPSGPLVVVDGRSRRRREAWAARSRAWREEIDSRLTAAGAERIEFRLPLGEDPEALTRPLLAFLRRRELRRRRG